MFPFPLLENEKRRFRSTSCGSNPNCTWKTCVTPVNWDCWAASVEPSDCGLSCPSTRKSSDGCRPNKNVWHTKTFLSLIFFTCSVDDGNENGSAVCLSSWVMISSRWLNSAIMDISSLCTNKINCQDIFLPPELIVLPWRAWGRRQIGNSDCAPRPGPISGPVSPFPVLFQNGRKFKWENSNQIGKQQGGKFPKRRTRLKGGGEKPIINSPVTGENKRRGEWIASSVRLPNKSLFGFSFNFFFRLLGFLFYALWLNNNLLIVCFFNPPPLCLKRAGGKLNK